MDKRQPGMIAAAAAVRATMSASAPAPVPVGDGGVLRLYSGGAFHGDRALALLPNDVIQITTSGPFGKDRQTRTQPVGQGAFQEARDHVTANPIPAKASARQDSRDNYGAEIVGMLVPDTSVNYMATCANARLRAPYQGRLVVLAANWGQPDG